MVVKYLQNMHENNWLQILQEMVNEEKTTSVPFEPSEYIFRIGTDIRKHLPQLLHSRYGDIDICVMNAWVTTLSNCICLDKKTRTEKEKLKLNAQFGASCFTNLENTDGLDLRSLRCVHNSENDFNNIYVKERKTMYDTFFKKGLKMKATNSTRQIALNVIKNVIFNDPATIVFWADGTKTVVKAEGEKFDPEKGLALAISKYYFNNKGYYFDVFKKWIPKEEHDEESTEQQLLEKKDDSDVEILTAIQFAKRTNKSIDTVQKECREGLYTGAIKFNGRWLIPYFGIVTGSDNLKDSNKGDSDDN